MKSTFSAPLAAAAFVLTSSVLSASNADAQNRTTQVSIQELDTVFTLDKAWQTEIDLENRTQGVPGASNPFAVEQQQRETIWLRKQISDRLTFSFGYASILRLAIPQVGARRYHENRYTLRARLTQPGDWGKHYEELWLQLRSFPNSSGVLLTFPVMRIRYGQQYRLGASHSVELYEELALSFAPSSYSTSTFDHIRLNALYSLPIAPRMSLQPGLRFQDAARSNGSRNLSYGPLFLVNYQP